MITECKMLSFVCQDEAIEFAKWTVETDQSMRWPQSFDLSDQTYQIKTLEENKKQFIDFYGDSESRANDLI